MHEVHVVGLQSQQLCRHHTFSHRPAAAISLDQCSPGPQQGGWSNPTNTHLGTKAIQWMMLICRNTDKEPHNLVVIDGHFKGG